jgi:hypothetical protein
VTPASIHVVTRSVVGRAATPYRGATNDEPLAERAPAPPRPHAEVLAAVQRIPNVTVQQNGNRLDVRRAQHELVVIVLRHDTPALADLTLVGNPILAILALEALVPLYGAIEFSLAEYRDLVDESEPGAAHARYEEYLRTQAERAAAEAEKRRIAMDAARLAAADSLVKPQAQPHTKLWAVIIIGLVTLTIITIFAARHFLRKGIGETCDADDQCRSGLCIRGADYDERYRYENSMCSEGCTSNKDCSGGMVCRAYVEDPWTTSRVRNVCQPKAWSYGF